MKDTPMVPAVGTEADRLIRTADVMLEVHRMVTADNVRAALHQFRFEFVHTYSSRCVGTPARRVARHEQRLLRSQEAPFAMSYTVPGTP